MGGEINIVRKLRTLLVPFLFANLFLLFLRGVKTQIESFDNAYFGTWFLLVLFECFLLIFLVKLALVKLRDCTNYAWIEMSIYVILIIAMLFLRDFLNKNYALVADLLSINLLVSYFPYFLLGYLFKKMRWERFLSMTMANTLAGFCIVVFAVISKYSVCANFLTFTLIKVCAVLALWKHFGQFSNEAVNRSRWMMLLTHLGAYSLDIYLIHFYFLFKVPQVSEFITTTGVNWSGINVCCEAIFAVVIAVIISKTSIFVSQTIFHNTLLKYCIGK